MAIKNPEHDKWSLPEGYRDLGWQMHTGNSEEIKKCYEEGHHNYKNPKHLREFDNSLFMNRSTDMIYICDECKIVWHVDSSD